ncbi:hypothetical protein BH09PLA1_BH09PLA1_19930 [soil metagenome]
MEKFPGQPPKWTSSGTSPVRHSDKPVRFLREYVDLACKEGQRDVAHTLRNPILFRGQRKPWPLVPKIGRSDLIEYGEDRERASVHELKLRAPLLIERTSRPQSPLEWLSLAQHHGMATRLLDWTENALAALWFAVHEIELPQDAHAVIWVLMPSTQFMFSGTADIFDTTKTWVVCPDHSHERARAQGAWFTLHHFDKSSKQFPALEQQENYLHSTDGDFPNLGRIDIDARFIPKLRLELDSAGVSSASVFPDLGGLCQRITERMSRLVKMPPK